MEPRNTIEQRFKEIQQIICDRLQEVDRKGKFQSDPWVRSGGGGGLTRILTNGRVIEKGGVNFSAVHGVTPEKIGNALGFQESTFYATGVSIVLHPHNPFMPIIHMNIRYFEMQSDDANNEGTYWFGGGIDLTPHYVVPKDAGVFHQKLKPICDQTHESYYSRFKKWADDYFYIKHRKETRGVGGIFFDRLNEKSEGLPFDKLWEFVQRVGLTFVPAYSYFVDKYADKPFDERHKQWQMLRRGRYVEFNLVWDKGTKFGLETDGRTESILMSLPAQASWDYDFQPLEGSPEQETQLLLRKDIEWISYA